MRFNAETQEQRETCRLPDDSPRATPHQRQTTHHIEIGKYATTALDAFDTDTSPAFK